jgi:hypothetical protein
MLELNLGEARRSFQHLDEPELSAEGKGKHYVQPTAPSVVHMSPLTTAKRGDLSLRVERSQRVRQKAIITTEEKVKVQKRLTRETYGSGKKFLLEEPLRELTFGRLSNQGERRSTKKLSQSSFVARGRQRPIDVGQDID